MRYEPLRSFDRSLRRLPQVDKERTKKAIIKLKDFFEGEAQPSGLGLKKLYEDIWEIRVDMRLRVIFRLQSDLVQWGFVGDHNQIRQFLRNKKGQK